MLVDDANEEYLALGTADLRRTAIVNKEFESLLPDNLQHEQVSGSVDLTDYQPNKLTYQISLDQPSLVVFSEIYYEEGWNATMDGEPVQHLRADYILRALPVDAGDHTVVFTFVFEPFEKGEKISLAGSWLVLLILLGGAGYSLYRQIRAITKEGTE
jgi:uncharacterized membrane protein YfhO